MLNVGLAVLAVGLAQAEPAHETSDDAYVAPGPLVLSPAPVLPAGDVLTVQVNTLDGMNIVGDAANEPSIVVDPTAPLRVAIGWRQFDTIASNFRQAGHSWSLDGGRSWSGKNVIEPGVFRTDPVLRSTSGGVFYYLSLRTSPAYENDLLISMDAGQTWPIKSYAYGGDKAWIAVDTSGGIGDGRIYQAWNTAGNQFAPATFNRSIDMGLSWEEPIEFIPGSGIDPTFGTVDVGPDGELFVVGFEPCCGPATLGVLTSLDAQDPDVPVPTFEFSEIAAPEGFRFRGTTASNPGGFTQAWIVVDDSGGAFHGRAYAMATIYRFGTNEHHLGIAWSDDAGQTWSDVVAVNDDTGQDAIFRWFGTISVAPNGRLDVVFNDNRDAPNGEVYLTRTYYTFSTDGGSTWSADEPVGPQWNSYIGWPNQNKIGDYYDMSSDLTGAHVAYATTYNGEQDVYYLRIGPYDCNCNGIDDEIDVADGTSTDCNHNGIPDECEIAAGTLADSDGDGVPDICSCPGDFNGDGLLNVLDFVAFQLAWQAGDPSADCDGSGSLDLVDFVCFQGLFQQGCE